MLYYGGADADCTPADEPARSGKVPGIEAGILPAVASIGSFTRGRFMSASVIPELIFVRPITGGSPFFTNSYNPVGKAMKH